jgi:protein gp37
MKKKPCIAERYSGKLRLIEKEFDVNYGRGKTIFMEHCNDLFAKDVPDEFICRIINHCSMFPENTYVFQTKNPARFYGFLHLMPRNTTNAILGATIETNRDMSEVSKAPPAQKRYEAMKNLSCRKFITVEPILRFDLKILAKWIGEIKPEFVNIGADSKGHNLIEPTYGEIVALAEELRNKYGIKIIEKHNMQRLIDKEKING